jgi:hypothetical protein
MKLVYLLTMISLLCMSATTSQVNSYINGNTLTADQLNSEFSNIYGTINSLDDANISASAAIDPSKISSLIGGDGIARQSDGSLDVNVDATTVKIISGQVAISDLPGSAIVAGGVGSTQIANGGVAKIDLAVKTATATASLGNVGLSTDSGASELVFTTGTSGDLVNNLINITTNGGPVSLSLMPGTSATSSYIECEDVTTDPCILELSRGGFTVVKIPFYVEGGKGRWPAGAFSFIDTPAAGTYQYKIKYEVPSATALRILNVRLMAYEL